MKATILVVDDDESILSVLSMFLEMEGHTVLVARTGDEAWETARLQAPDLILCDWLLPGLDGLQVCRRIKEDVQLRSIYTVLITAKDRQDDKIRALEAGADDFLTKPLDMAELKARIQVGLRLVEHQHSLQTIALTDELTGLFNRRAFQTILNKEFDRARRYGSALSLLLLDVDRFKAINDRLGHDAGDRVLWVVGNSLARSIRCSDLAFRIGGDEFAVIMPEGSTGAEAAAVRLRRQFAERHREAPEDPERPTLSIGVAALDASETSEALFRRADGNMYADKRRQSSELTSA